VFFSNRTQEEVKRMSNVVKTVKSTKVSKRSVIIDIMTNNSTSAMQDVVKLIVSSTAFVHHAQSEAEARYYYGKFVRTGVAPGTVVRAPKKVKAMTTKPVKSKLAAPVVAPTKTVAPRVKPAVKPVVKPTDAAAPVVKPAPRAPSVFEDDLTIPDFLKRIKTSSAVAV
jgi:hypothetical protein